MKIISKGALIILAILYNYYIHPQGDFQRNYTELYRHFRKHRKKKKTQKHSNNGNDIEEVIGVDKSILSEYKKHINKKYNNYTNSTTTSFLLKGCAAFFTTGKVSGWLAVHVYRAKNLFLKKKKFSSTYITIIVQKRLAKKIFF